VLSNTTPRRFLLRVRAWECHHPWEEQKGGTIPDIRRPKRFPWYIEFDDSAVFALVEATLDDEVFVGVIWYCADTLEIIGIASNDGHS
jgi:hypothetical protein